MSTKDSPSFRLALRASRLQSEGKQYGATVSITVTRRSADTHACITGHPDIWGCGRGQYEAIGNLVMSHPEHFGIEFVTSGRVIPANINRSAGGKRVVGECPCGWLVIGRETKCEKCGCGLDWKEVIR